MPDHVLFDPSDYARDLQHLLMSDSKRISFLLRAETSWSTQVGDHEKIIMVGII